MPRHVGIIMDGNGRWANQQHHPRVYGHQNATQAVRETVEGAAELGIEVLTLFAFSTENWKRPAQEVEALMRLFEEFLGQELEGLIKNQIRLVTIGKKDRLPAYVLEPLEKAIEATRGNRRMTLCLAVDYGSRDEIARAARQIALDCAAGKLTADQITEELIPSYLDTASLPELDLVIRTSGEQRLSNFLLWQAAYAEFYFTELLWPDFNKAELEQALVQYSKRHRRVGAVHGT